MAGSVLPLEKNTATQNARLSYSKGLRIERAQDDLPAVTAPAVDGTLERDNVEMEIRSTPPALRCMGYHFDSGSKTRDLYVRLVSFVPFVVQEFQH